MLGIEPRVPCALPCPSSSGSSLSNSFFLWYEIVLCRKFWCWYHLWQLLQDSLVGCCIWECHPSLSTQIPLSFYRYISKMCSTWVWWTAHPVESEPLSSHQALSRLKTQDSFSLCPSALLPTCPHPFLPPPPLDMYIHPVIRPCILGKCLNTFYYLS